MIRQPPSSPLFPYPTLFRSVVQVELDRAPVAVPRALQRPGRAVDVATARRQAVAGMLLDPLPDRPALEGDEGVQGILAGRLDLVREPRRPARVEAAGPRRAGVAADLLVLAALPVDRAELAQVVAEDVGVVDPDVQSDRPGVLHV